jgi:hypothetical protein
MNNGVILEKKAGHIIAKEMIELALRNCPTVSGFAVREGNVISYEFSDKASTAEGIMKLQEATKDFPLFLFLGNWPSDHDVKKDIQPFCVKDENDDVVVAYFCEGDFNKFTKAGRTDEGNLQTDLIDPILFDIYETVEGDIGKFTAKLHSPLFQKQLTTAIGHRGMFAFLPKEGDPIVFGNNELGGKFEWGNTSQLFGYGTPKKEEAPIITIAAAEGKKRKFSSFLGGTHEKAPVPSAPHPDATKTAPELPAKPLEAPKTDTAVKENTTSIFPPPKLTGSARNKWFRLMNGGELPTNHQSQKTSVQVTPEVFAVAKNFNSISTLAEISQLEDTLKGKVKTATPPVAGGSKLEPAVKLATSQILKPSPTDYLPTLTDDDMTKTTALLASWYDRDRSKGPSPLEIQKAEAAWPVFSEKAGIKLEEIMWWPVKDIASLPDKSKVLLILELRRLYANGLDLKSLVNTAPKEVPPIQSKTIEAPVSGAKGRMSKFLGLKKAS